MLIRVTPWHVLVGRFSAQLYQLTGRRGMLILYAYALLGFGCLRTVTPDFGGLAQRVRLFGFCRAEKGGFGIWRGASIAPACTCMQGAESIFRNGLL